MNVHANVVVGFFRRMVFALAAIFALWGASAQGAAFQYYYSYNTPWGAYGPGFDTSSLGSVCAAGITAMYRTWAAQNTPQYFATGCGLFPAQGTVVVTIGWTDALGNIHYAPQPAAVGNINSCSGPGPLLFSNTNTSVDCSGAITSVPPPNLNRNQARCILCDFLHDLIFVAEPVNSATGDKVEEVTDFSTAGSGQLFGLTRVYNSAFQTARAGQMGGHWRTNFDRSLGFIPSSASLPAYSLAVGYNTYCAPAGCGGSAAGSTGVFPSNITCLTYQNVCIAQSPLDWENIAPGTDPTQYKVVVCTKEGGTLIFVWNGTQWVSQDSDVKTTLTMLGSGPSNITGWTYVNENDEIETYDTAGRLLSIKSRNGVVDTLTYTGTQQFPSSVVDTFGHQIQFTYGTNGVLSSLTDPNGQVWQYTFDANWNLTSVTGPDGFVRKYQYTDSRFPNSLTAIVDENGNTIDSTTYDQYNRAISTAGAGGVNSTGINYVSTYTSTAVTNPLNEVDTYNFANINWGLKVSSVTRSVGGTKTITYDANGNRTGITDFNGVTSTFAYDTTRNLETSRTEASSTAQARTITTTWHPTYRLPATITEPGRTTSYTYDSNGNPLTKTVTDTATNASQTWTWTYNGYGQVLTVKGPRSDVNATTTYAYDTAGNLTSITNAANMVTSFGRYNAMGYPGTITDPNGLVTTLTYDTRNRLKTQAVGSLLTTYGYDSAGQLTSVTLPDGNVVTYVYDAAHRLTEVDDKAGDKIVYTLDAMGNRTQVRMADSGGLTQLMKRIDQGLAHARMFASR